MKINVDNQKEIFNELVKMSKKCLKYGDVPVAAIIIKDHRIIGKGINTREKYHNTINHAEIVAITKANKCTSKWNLAGSDLYVTLKPCSMCMEAIKQARIDNVYYLLDKPSNKKEYNKTQFNKVNMGDLEENYQKILSDFFTKLR